MDSLSGGNMLFGCMRSDIGERLRLIHKYHVTPILHPSKNSFLEKPRKLELLIMVIVAGGIRPPGSDKTPVAHRDEDGSETVSIWCFVESMIPRDLLSREKGFHGNRQIILDLIVGIII